MDGRPKNILNSRITYFIIIIIKYYYLTVFKWQMVDRNGIVSWNGIDFTFICNAFPISLSVALWLLYEPLIWIDTGNEIHTIYIKKKMLTELIIFEI